MRFFNYTGGRYLPSFFIPSALGYTKNMDTERKRLLLVRHGQTQMNAQDLIQGSWDSPLTKEGIEQARLVKAYLEKRNIPFDHYYTSTAGRTSQTMEEITDQPYERLKGLRETDFGLYEGKPCFLNPGHPFNDFFVAYGGSDEADDQTRMVKTCTELMEKEDHHNVLAVSHAGANMLFLQNWIDLDEMDIPLPPPNASIFEYEYLPEEKRFKVVDVITPAKQRDFLEKMDEK